jgi:hypothetical protein
MQIFSVEFYFNYKGELVQDVTANLTFEVDTFADLWMQLEMGEKDGSTKQRLLDTMAEAEVDVQFDSFGFGNIYNQVGELEFDAENPEDLQLTSLSPEGESIIEDEDYSDEDDETKILH